MKNTLISTLSNRESAREFDMTVTALRQRGALFQRAPGWSDVAEGRCVQLSAALRLVREAGELGARDVVLMMDDDMGIQPDDAQALVSEARASGVACSAVYPTAEVNGGKGRNAGTRHETAPGRWLIGLGCMAIPVPLLLELERNSEPFELRGQLYTEFTWSCAENRRWLSEDYRLCLRLGGVRLLPIPAGHKKAIMLWPDQETLDEVRQLNAAATNHG